METTVIHTLFASPTGEMAEPRQRSDVPEMSRKDLRKSERQISGPTKTFDGCFFMWKLCEIIVNFESLSFGRSGFTFCIDYTNSICIAQYVTCIFLCIRYIYIYTHSTIQSIRKFIKDKSC